MDIKKLSRSPSGHLVKNLDGDWAFLPAPLPPKLDYTPELVSLQSAADRALGALEGMGCTLPNANLLVMPYMRQEAVLSSRIEGTQASLSDLFLYEAAKNSTPNTPDVKEVFNYVTAMNHGLKRLKELPLSLRLVRELHEKLMDGVRGEEQRPGEFRKRQNWVGPDGSKIENSIYVPPPLEALTTVLGDWEKFLHAKTSLPPLAQCAFMHAQFESIHPFLDGNGRIGRLLITLFLCEKEHLSRPLLYLSGYLERNRSEYYTRLQAIREEGDWAGWLAFFLSAVTQQSVEAMESAHRIMQLKEKYRGLLQKKKRTTVTVLTLLDSLFLNPYVTILEASQRMRVSFPTAQSAIEKLEELGIVTEMTGQDRYRYYFAEELLKTIESRPGKNGDAMDAAGK